MAQSRLGVWVLESSARLSKPCLLFLISLPFSAAYSSSITSESYDALIHQIRQGEVATGLAQLRAWRASFPDNERILFDHAAISSDAEQHEEALQDSARIVGAHTPTYVLLAIGRSARITQRWALAEAAYRHLLERDHQDAQAHAGIAYIYLAQNDSERALAYAESQLPAYDQRDIAHVPLYIALGEVQDARQQWLQAAHVYAIAQSLQPDLRFAVRGRVFALSRLGAPYVAQEVASQYPDYFSDEEKRRFADDIAAHSIGFGQAQQANDSTINRFERSDLGLFRNALVQSRFDQAASANDVDPPALTATARGSVNAFTPAQLSTLFDRVVALRDRVRMADTIALYKELQALGVDLPTYVRVAAADAYLYLREPEKARDIYRAAIDASEEGDPGVFGWKIALMYAYGESNQFDEAQNEADLLAAAIPPLQFKGVRGLEAPHPEHGPALQMAGLMRLYADRLDDAQQKLADLRERAPDNSGVRAAWASMLSARGRPRDALEELTRLQIDFPESLSAGIGRADLLLALQEFDRAREVMVPLVQHYPENKGVHDLQQKFARHDSMHLRIETSLGSGGNNTGADSTLLASLHSVPLDDSLGSQYRVFARSIRAQGEDDGVDVARTRVGFGMDYRVRDLLAEVEFHHARSRTGVALAISWDLSDDWKVRAAADSNTINLPASALRNDVHAKTLSTSLLWTPHGGRTVGASLSRTTFSDSNDRSGVGLWWSERWISEPFFKFDTTVGWGATTNNFQGATYFAPKRDSEINLTLMGEWLNWRRYERSFRQRAFATLGQYRQHGFGAGATADLRYEHEWRNEYAATVRYGAGRAFHPYDGVREYRNYAYFNLFWAMR